MKQHPMIFSAASVRAILSGRKTQTRRLITFSPRETGLTARHDLLPEESWVDGIEVDGHHYGYLHTRYAHWEDSLEDGTWVRVVPPCEPADAIWVREAWGEAEDVYGGTHIVYRADDTCSLVGASVDDGDRLLHGPVKRDMTWFSEGDFDPLCVAEPDRWRSSLFIHKWASRLWLRVGDVRPQRVRDISDEDALREGYGSREAFLEAFFALNAKRLKRKWVNADNPWVWVINFERMPWGDGRDYQKEDDAKHE